MKLFNIFNWVQNLVEAFTFYGGGSGGGGTTTSTSYSTNLPEYAQPFYEELLKQAGKQSFTTDSSGNVTGIKPFVPYTGERVAGFTPEQLAIQQQVAELQSPTEFNQAGAGLSSLQSLGLYNAQTGLNRALNYAPGAISAQNISAPNLSNFQMGAPSNINAPGVFQYGMNAAQSNFNPNLTNYQMQGPSNINVPSLFQYGMSAAQMGYNPNLAEYQMGPAQNVTTQNFGQSAADAYMSPYIKAAIDPALREARLQGDLQKQAGMTGAIGRGTFGGARQALLQAEQERGTQRTMADITATGMEKAYQNAQAQFQADQARQLQAQQANQQAGLTTGQQNLAARLGVQQLGTQSDLQARLANLSNVQQANTQNLAAQLQTQGLSAEQAMKAALANQQAQQTTQQQNLAALLNTQQLGTQTGAQMALANLSNAQQANVQNLAAQLQTQGLSAENAMKAALANQQAGLTTGQQNLAALLGVQQLGSGQRLESQKANQAAALQAAQLTQQGQQYAAGLGKDVGLAGLSSALEGSKALGALGATEQQANLERLKAKAATAEEKQALQQQINDLQYQKFQEQQNYQRTLLEYYSNILRGNAGALGSTQVAYTPAPSIASQVGGLGLAGLGLYNLLGKG